MIILTNIYMARGNIFNFIKINNISCDVMINDDIKIIYITIILVRKKEYY